MPATPNTLLDRMNLEMPVTDAHRKAAFTAMHWRGWTFEAAQKVDLRRRLIEARAHQIRTKAWLATQERSVVPLKHCKPGADGHPAKWSTQLVMGPLYSRTQAHLNQTETTD